MINHSRDRSFPFASSISFMDFQIFSDSHFLSDFYRHPQDFLLQIHPDPDPATRPCPDLGPFPGASALAEAAGADSEEAPGAWPMEAWLGGGNEDNSGKIHQDPTQDICNWLDIKISGVGQTESNILLLNGDLNSTVQIYSVT